MKKIFVTFLSIITISSAMFLGGCSMPSSRSKKGLKKIDPQALTPEGKIKSYEIDKKSLTQNPIGGLMFDLIINGDEEVTLGYVITEDENGKFHRDGTAWSPKLIELMDEENVNSNEE